MAVGAHERRHVRPLDALGRRSPENWRDFSHDPQRNGSVNRREFIGAGVLALPGLRACGARSASASALALATADTESHIVVVAPASGRILQRLPAVEGPRSIQSRAGVIAVCAHTQAGKVSLIERAGDRIATRRVLGGFSEPRYTALVGRFAFVTDSGTGRARDHRSRARPRRAPRPRSATSRGTSRSGAARCTRRSVRAQPGSSPSMSPTR